MAKNNQQKRIYVIFIAAIIALVALGFANYLIARNINGGNNFLIYWQGTRSFLFGKISPYSEEANSLIRETVVKFGSETEEIGGKFAKPFYSTFIYVPFSLIKDSLIARTVWMTFLTILMIAILVGSIKLPYLNCPFWIIGVILISAFFSLTSLFAINNGNTVFITSALLLFALINIRDGNDEIAGLLLAGATIDPNLSLLLILYICLWTFRKNRRKVFAWFLGAVVIILGFSILLIPDWLLQYARQFVPLFRFPADGTMAAQLVLWGGDIGMRLAITLSVILGIVLLVEWYLSMRGGMRNFLWCAMMTLAVSQLIGIRTDPLNLVLLFPPFIFSLALIAERWGSSSYKFIALISVGVTIFYWGINLTSLISMNRYAVLASLIIPFPLIVILLLYWSSWWLNHSTKSGLEQPKLPL